MPRTVVAAASQDAARAGRDVADAGGSAVDAAIAAALVSMTTELGIVSIGGGAFLTIWGPDAEPVVIDGYAEMPGRGRHGDPHVRTDRVFMGYGGGMETIVGWGSVATPGALAAFETASDRFGAVPWRELFKPSIHLAHSGFEVTAASAYYLQYAHDVVYGWDDETAPTYNRPDGTPVEAGEIVTNVPLAETLTDIGKRGAAHLYKGELGAALARTSAERGGLITREDLAAYEAVVREPLTTTMRDWKVATNAPPAVGGITVASLVALLDRMHLAGWDAESVARYVDAQEAVFSFRRTELDGHRDRFEAAEAAMAAASKADLAAFHTSPSTIHVSAVDSTGLGCAITSSAGYGSGATIPGTGFGLNNSLGEIELISEGLHALPVGSRLLSNMAPTIARHADGATIAIGSPGADRITSAIATVLYNHIVCEMPLDKAVAAPRVHAEVFDGSPTIAVEPGIDTGALNNRAIRELPERSMYFGGVQVAKMNQAGGLTGAADPRRSGAVLVGGHG